MSPPIRWLAPPSARTLTPNRYGPAYNPQYILPVDVAILHYTGGYSYTSSVRWLANLVRGKDGQIIPAKASAHLVIGRAGEVHQLVPLDERAWHAGGRSSRWRGRTVNLRSIGIELANLGPMTAKGGGLLDSWGRPFTGPTVTDADGRAWEAYPDPQLEAVAWVLEILVGLFPALALEDEGPGELPRITTHQAVDPTRKTDPGPAFPLDLIRAHALGRA